MGSWDSIGKFQSELERIERVTGDLDVLLVMSWVVRRHHVTRRLTGLREGQQDRRRWVGRGMYDTEVCVKMKMLCSRKSRPENAVEGGGGSC